MHLLFCAHSIIFYHILGVLNLDIIRYMQHQQLPFNLYKTCIHTSLFNIPWQVYVCVCGGGGGGQLINIVSPSSLIDMSIYNQYFGDAGPRQSLMSC